jgi:hypothetical protein
MTKMVGCRTFVEMDKIDAEYNSGKRLDGAVH